MLSENEKNQSLYYDKVAKVYDEHHSHPISIMYRKEFAYKYLFDSINMNQYYCLDAMCGGGEWSEYMLGRGAKVVGLDVSDECCKIYKQRFSDCEVHNRSIIDSGFPDNTFDLVATDSLHHVQPNVENAIDEIYRILKPGGYFIFWEPYEGSIFDIFRKIWYRKDVYFEKNEKSIDLKNLKEKNKNRFSFELEKYGGNIAYLTIVTSMILRIPPSLKKYYYRPVFFIEKLFSSIQTKRTSVYVLGRWKK